MLERLNEDMSREEFMLELTAPLPGYTSPVDTRRVAEDEMAVFRSGRQAMGI